VAVSKKEKKLKGNQVDSFVAEAFLLLEKDDIPVGVLLRP
jgi:hypothetical protein